MAKLTLSDIVTFVNDVAAKLTYQQNNDLIEAAIENTLSRDGTSPNTMTVDLDLNSKKVINLADPTNGGDAVSKTYGDANYLTGVAGPTGPQGPAGPSGSGSGDVLGPASVTDNRLTRWNGTTGDLIQESGITVNDTDDLSGIKDITLSGTVDGRDVDADGTKLDGISSGAEVNPSVVSQAEAEAGTATTERIWTALRVAQAIAALASSGFASGTKMLFQQTTAPDGWTKETTHDDKALRLVTGTVGSGGVTGFTTVFGAAKVTGSTSPGTVSHGHQERIFTAGADTDVNLAAATIDSTTPGTRGPTTADTGAGSAHTHTEVLDMQYVDFIICEKD